MKHILEYQSWISLTEMIIPAQFRQFVKKHGFKLECSNCDSSFREHGPGYWSDTRKAHGTDSHEGGYAGNWSKYYLIINTSNACKFGATDFDRSATTYGRVNYYSGDAYIEADFSYNKDIVDFYEIYLCKKSYTLEQAKELVLKHGVYFDKNEPEDSGDHYFLYSINKKMPHSVLEEIINYLKTPTQTSDLEQKYKPESDMPQAT